MDSARRKQAAVVLWLADGIMSVRLRIESLSRHQPVRAHRLDDPRRLFQRHDPTIAQTPDGYLWLGTEFGLFRFDGVRPVPWTPPGSERLPSAAI